MGGESHARIERLWSETAIVETPRGTIHYSDGTVPKDVTPTKTVLTPSQVWERVRDSEGWEDGHSYSGNFAVKPGFIVFGQADVDRDVLRMAGEVVQGLEYEENYEWYPLRDRTDAYCGWREGYGRYCNDGKTIEKQEATLADGTTVMATVTVDCPQCKGTGRRPFTEQERAAGDERRALIAKAVEAFGLPALRRASKQYTDKWGNAAALVGRGYVWFGGVCSS